MKNIKWCNISQSACKLSKKGHEVKFMTANNNYNDGGNHRKKYNDNCKSDNRQNNFHSCDIGFI